MMAYLVDGWNNFCRVFEIPDEYPSGFCFGGGKPVNFQMVDWFNPVPGLGQPTLSKVRWLGEVGDFEVKTVTIEELEQTLVPFLEKKQYIKPGQEYLVLFDFGASLRFRAHDTVCDLCGAVQDKSLCDGCKQGLEDQTVCPDCGSRDNSGSVFPEGRCVNCHHVYQMGKGD
jgi:hypothetical protein